MKKILLATIVTILSLNASAQIVAKLEITEPIEGICNQEEVYSLFPMFGGQVKAICPISNEEIVSKLNTEVQFLQNNPKFKTKGMVNVIINCEGELVRSSMGIPTKSSELDTQITAVMKTIMGWKAGKLNGKNVDSTINYSFKVKKGILYFE